MHNINLIITFLLFIAPFTIIIHEIGHMAGAIIVKADNVHLSIGQGKKVFTVSLRKLVIHIHAIFFMGGQATSKREKPYGPMDILLITISGPLMNVFLASAIYFLFKVHSSDYILLFIFFNLWVGLGNLIPFKIREKYSDGYIIFHTLINYDKIR